VILRDVCIMRNIAIKLVLMPSRIAATPFPQPQLARA
jgi:hypothetical protein